MKLLITIALLFFIGCGDGDGLEPTIGQSLTSPTATAGTVADNSADQPPPTTPQFVTINGYSGEMMEPALSRDGRYLFFNNPNSDPNPDLHVSERIDDLTFRYLGPLTAANTPELDAVATVATNGRFLFISTRDYPTTLNTVFGGDFTSGTLTNVAPQISLATAQLGIIIFDVGVSADGQELIMAEGLFSGSGVPDEANLVLARFDGTNYNQVPTPIFDAINTSAREYAPDLSADGLKLLLTRLPQGSFEPQIFLSQRTNATEPFEVPTLVPGLQNFVEAGTFTPDGQRFYYHARVDGRNQLFLATL